MMDINTDIAEFFAERFSFKGFEFKAHKFDESVERQIMVGLSGNASGPITLNNELTLRTLTIWVRGKKGEKFGVPIECIEYLRTFILNTSTFSTSNYKISGFRPMNQYSRPILDASDRYIYSFDVELNYVRKED